MALDGLTLTSNDEHYRATSAGSGTQSFVNMDYMIDYEMFSKEIYENYCVVSTTCSQYLESITIVQNTLFTENLIPYGDIIKRSIPTDPQHYSLLLDYYLRANMEERTRAVFENYVVELRTRLDAAMSLVSFQPIAQMLAEDFSDMKAPI